MSERELSKLRVVGDFLITDVAKISHVANKIFFIGHSHRRCQLLSLGFSKSLDRRGINLAARICKTNKEPTMVCRPPLQCLSQTEMSEEKVRQCNAPKIP